MAIKINQSTRVGEPVTKRGTSSAKPQTTFERTLSAQKSVLQSDALKALLHKIDEQAARIQVSRTIRDLQRYKKYVRAFLQEAVQAGLDTKESRSWQHGGTKQMLVKHVDQKLIEMTNEWLDKNKDELDLLDQLDEIRGILINLYV